MNLIAAASQPTDFVSLHTAVKYVAGAYIVVLAVILIYVAIMAVRLTRNQQELAELAELVEQRDAGAAESPDLVPADRPATPSAL